VKVRIEISASYAATEIMSESVEIGIVTTALPQ
jgi:hypothetical protein